MVNEDELSRSMVAKKFSATALPLVILGGLTAVEEFGKTSIIAAGGSKNIAVESLMSLTLGVLLSSDIGYLSPIQPMITIVHGRSKAPEITNIQKRACELQVGHIVRQGWMLAGLLSLPTGIILYNSEHLLNALGQNQELTSIVGPYAKIVAFATPAIYFSVVDGALLRATKKMKSILLFNLAGAAITLGISAVLVPGALGFEAQGINGVGYAILIKEWIIWTAAKVYFFTNEFKPNRIFNFRSTNLNVVKRILCERICKLGTCFTFLTWSEQAKGFLIGLMMGRLGTEQLIINQAASVYLQFLVPPSLGIRQGAQIIVGHYKGLHEYPLMKRFGNLGILLEFSLNTLPLIPYVLFPIELTTYFVPQSEIEDLETLVRLTFLVTAIGRILNAIQAPASENLKGVLDIYFPTIVQFLSSVILTLPLCYLMGFELDWNLVGLGAAACIGTASSIPALMYRWLHIERYIVEREENQPDPEEVLIDLDLPEVDPDDDQGNDPDQRIDENPNALVLENGHGERAETLSSVESKEEAERSEKEKQEGDIAMGSPVSESFPAEDSDSVENTLLDRDALTSDSTVSTRSESVSVRTYTPGYQSMGERQPSPPKGVSEPEVATRSEVCVQVVL